MCGVARPAAEVYGQVGPVLYRVQQKGPGGLCKDIGKEPMSLSGQIGVAEQVLHWGIIRPDVGVSSQER